MQYVTTSIGFLLLAAWLAFLFRWWYSYLTVLSVNLDIPERRRRAAARYPFVMLAVIIPMGAVLLSLIRWTSVNPIIIATGLVVAVVPGIVWLSRRAALKKLGYGR